MKGLKFLFLLYILSLPFTSAFAFSAVGASPIVFSLFLFLFYTSGIFTNQYQLYLKNTFFFFSWYIILLSSFFINDVGEKSSNHLLLYSIVTFCLYFGVRNIMIVILNKDVLFWNVILHYLSIIVLISSLYAIIEFLLVNFMGVNINNYIPHAFQEYQPWALGFIRARSFIEESGHFAFFLETLSPISIYYILRGEKSVFIKCFYILSIFLALIFTFSSFGFLSLVISIGIFLYYYYISFSKKIKIKYRFFLSIGIIIFVGILGFAFFDFFSSVIGAKLQGSDSYLYRATRVSLAISQLHGENWLFGFGPGSYDTLKVDSYISVFINILMDSGLFGLSVFILFLIKQLSYLFRIKDSAAKLVFLISFITSTFHYFYIGNYYYPWYWLLLSMIYVYYLYEKKIIKSQND